MTLLVTLIVAATALNGLLGGLSFDGALVKLPARHRIGAVAYATFARGNDLGNGLWVYPSSAIGAALLTVIATIVAYVAHASSAVLLPLTIATIVTIVTIGHFVVTSRAAPIMLRVGKTPDNAAVLAPLLDRFAHWHAARATLQVLTFFVMLWALVVAR